MTANPTPAAHELRIRLAEPDDGGLLERLAALDSQAPLQGDALIAELDGIAVAALSLQNGRLIADPFAHTATVREHLRLLAASIQPTKRPPVPLKRPLRLAFLGGGAA